MKFALVLILANILIWTLAACQRVSTAPSPEIMTDKDQIETASRPNVAISISEIQVGECMSLALLVDILSNPMFDYPSALMTTDFHILDETMSSGNAKYLAYSSFYYRMAPAKDLVPFTHADQSDCKSLKLKMASGQLLTYNIVESSDRYLKFQLTKDFGDEVPNYQKEALFKRSQPDEISVHFVSESEIKIVKKIKSFDPLCKKKKRGYDARVTEVFSWKKDQAELPTEYRVEERYAGLVMSALKTPLEMVAARPLPVATIKDMMVSPALDEIKICE